MPGPPDDATGSALREFVGVLWLRRWSVLLLILVAVAAAALFGARQEQRYQAVARVQATNPIATITSSSPLAGQPNMPTEQTLAGSQSVTDCAWVIFEAGGGLANKLCGPSVEEYTPEYSEADPPSTFRAKLSASVPEGTTIIAFAYTDGAPKAAQAGANAFADAYVWWKSIQANAKVAGLRQPLLAEQADLQSQVSDLNVAIIDAAEAGDSATVAALQVQLNALYNNLQVVSQQLIDSSPAKVEPPSVVTPAIAPIEPVGPQMPLIVAFGFLVGLSLGAAQASIRERFDDRLRGRADLERAVGTPVLAVIPKLRSWRRRTETHLVTTEAPASPEAESYRTLRTNLLFSAAERGVRTIVVTSALAGEGKTTTAANLAAVLAEAGKRVIVVSCDLRKPRVHLFFGRRRAPGLADVLSSGRSLDEALQDAGRANLWLLASGPVPAGPAELLQTPRMEQVLKDLVESHEFVIIDTPPVLAVADALAIAGMADGVLLVADAQSTDRRAIEQTVRQLDLVGAHLVGCVLNDYDPSKVRSYAERYGYYGTYAASAGSGRSEAGGDRGDAEASSPSAAEPRSGAEPPT